MPSLRTYRRAEAWEWLARHGIETRVAADGTADLAFEHDRVRVEIQTRSRAPRPSEPLPRPASDHQVLFVTGDSVSRRQADRFNEAGWWFIAPNRAQVAHVRVAPEVTAAVDEPLVEKWPAAKSRLIHALLLASLANEDVSDYQRRVADTAGVTQAYVSKVLAKLRAECGIADMRHLSPQQWLSLAQQWLQRRTWMVMTTYWYSLSSPAEVVDVMVSTQPDMVLSGDFSADRQAPWRQPTRPVFLAGQTPNLQELVPATGVDDSTVTVHITNDPVLLESVAIVDSGSRPMRLADPLQTAWDIAQYPASDTDAAITHLLDTAMKSRWTDE